MNQLLCMKLTARAPAHNIVQSQKTRSENVDLEDKKKEGNSKFLPRPTVDSRGHRKFLRFCLVTKDI